MAGLLWYRSYMDSLANTSGYYPDIHAGHADRVAELTLDTPYLIRETPAGYNQLELMELVGGTVAWNQLVKNGNFVNTTEWNVQNATLAVSGGVATITPLNNGSSAFMVQSISIRDHVYFAAFSVNTPSSTGTINFEMRDANAVQIICASTQTGQWERCESIYKITSSNVDSGYVRIRTRTPQTAGEAFAVKEIVLIDLTAYLNPTIADYVYSLEQATAGGGIAWLKSYGYFTEDYYAYSAPTLQSVEATAHVTKDSNNTTIATYPLDSDLVLRGIPKLDNGVLSYDGDTYEWNGTVTRKFGERAYQAGDESLTDAITDGTNTVYKLTTPTTESADPFTAVQTVEEGGTEEFVTSNNVPVGNVSVYRRA